MAKEIDFNQGELKEVRDAKEKARTKLVKALKKGIYGNELQSIVDSYNKYSERLEALEINLGIKKQHIA